MGKGPLLVYHMLGLKIKANKEVLELLRKEVLLKEIKMEKLWYFEHAKQNNTPNNITDQTT